MLVSSTTTEPDFNFLLYLQDLGGAFPDKKILYFTYFDCDGKAELTSNHIQIEDLDSLSHYLESLRA